MAEASDLDACHRCIKMITDVIEAEGYSISD
jgi:hypothetical protein